jgi:hypothetical protein
MKLAIMQPYFFPYIGYFQLIQAVDAFVVYDDVNYINRGWINRNFLLSQNQGQRVTLSLEGASQNKQINQIAVSENNGKLLSTIKQNYSKSPEFTFVYPLIEQIVTHQEKNLARFLNYSLRLVCDYLDLRPQWFVSSDIKKDNTLRGQDKIMAICKELGATQYINLPGGKELYDQEFFVEQGLKLSFIEPRPIMYKQFGGDFVPYLSIIDVLMFNDRENARMLLREYEIV